MLTLSGPVDGAEHRFARGAGHFGGIARFAIERSHRKPGKGGGLHVVGVQPEIRSRRQGDLPKALGKPSDEVPVVHATAADQQFAGPGGVLADSVRDWQFFEKGRFEDNLYEVPHDALVVLGAYGHGLIKDFVFGNKMERIQSTISNNLLIAGPKYSAGY